MPAPVDLDAWELWFALHDDICEEAGLRTLSDIVAEVSESRETYQ